MHRIFRGISCILRLMRKESPPAKIDTPGVHHAELRRRRKNERPDGGHWIWKRSPGIDFPLRSSTVPFATSVQRSIRIIESQSLKCYFFLVTALSSSGQWHEQGVCWIRISLVDLLISSFISCFMQANGQVTKILGINILFYNKFSSLFRRTEMALVFQCL